MNDIPTQFFVLARVSDCVASDLALSTVLDDKEQLTRKSHDFMS